MCGLATAGGCRSTTRATSPIAGTVVLLALTVFFALAMGAAVPNSIQSVEPTSTATIDLSVEGSTLVFRHDYGEPLAVDQLSIQIAVDGEPLDEQPPVPFFAAHGFESGPTGPFNSASDNEWRVGETASVTVAGTNRPTIESESTVSVRIATGNGAVIQMTAAA